MLPTLVASEEDAHLLVYSNDSHQMSPAVSRQVCAKFTVTNTLHRPTGMGDPLYYGIALIIRAIPFYSIVHSA